MFWSVVYCVTAVAMRVQTGATGLSLSEVAFAFRGAFNCVLKIAGRES